MYLVSSLHVYHDYFDYGVIQDPIKSYESLEIANEKCRELFNYIITSDTDLSIEWTEYLKEHPNTKINDPDVELLTGNHIMAYTDNYDNDGCLYLELYNNDNRDINHVIVQVSII